MSSTGFNNVNFFSYFPFLQIFPEILFEMQSKLFKERRQPPRYETLSGTVLKSIYLCTDTGSF